MINPPILSGVELDGATVEQLLRAQYQLQLATFGFVSAFVIFFFTFKFLVWFLPKYWYRGEE